MGHRAPHSYSLHSTGILPSVSQHCHQPVFLPPKLTDDRITEWVMLEGTPSTAAALHRTHSALTATHPNPAHPSCISTNAFRPAQASSTAALLHQQRAVLQHRLGAGLCCVTQDIGAAHPLQ